MVRRNGIMTFSLALVVVLAACGQTGRTSAGASRSTTTTTASRPSPTTTSPSTTSPASASTSTSAPLIGAPPCRGAQMTGSAPQAGAAAGGQDTIRVTLASTATTQCELKGYPTVQMYGVNSQPLSTHVTDVNAPEPVLVVAPHQAAQFRVEDVDYNITAGRPCTPAAGHVSVGLPGGESPVPGGESPVIVAGAPFHPCNGQLRVYPFEPTGRA
ncbi:MAG: DUF4232 domain-containing protein [Acidimicrobiales bacterium]